MLTSPTDSYPDRRYAWYVVALLLLALTISYVDRQILNLMVNPIRADLQISDTGISLLQGLAFVIFYSLMGIVLGRWADRGHRQRLIILGIVVWSLATAACGLARNFTELFVARIFVGVGEAALSPAAYSLISDYFPPAARARAMSVYTMGGPLGAGLALILGGAAVQATSNSGPLQLPLLGSVQAWQAAFFIVGLPGLLLAAAMFSVKEPARKERLAANTNVAGLGTFLRHNRRVLTLVCIGFGLTSTLVFGIGAWLPTTYIRLHGWSAGKIATLSGLSMLTFGIAGVLAAGQIADRLRTRQSDSNIRMSFWALLIMLPAVPVIGLTESPWLGIAALCWVNFFIGVPGGLGVPTLHALVPNEFRGRVTAIYLFIAIFLGLALGPVLIALCTDLLFADDQAVGRSMALVTTVATVVSALTLLAAKRAYRPATTAD